MASSPDPSARRLGPAAWWGVVGVLLLLADAIWRLWPKAVEALRGPLDAVEWVGLVGVVTFMGAVEGYRGFQKAFSPRVAARALVVEDLGLGAKLLAPLFVMALFNATPKRLVVSWGLVVFIVALVIGVCYLEQPWRGIVDAGVIVGLTWGAVSIVVFAAKAARGTLGDVDPELSDG